MLTGKPTTVCHTPQEMVDLLVRLGILFPPKKKK